MGLALHELGPNLGMTLLKNVRCGLVIDVSHKSLQCDHNQYYHKSWTQRSRGPPNKSKGRAPLMVKCKTLEFYQKCVTFRIPMAMSVMCTYMYMWASWAMGDLRQRKIESGHFKLKFSLEASSPSARVKAVRWFNDSEFMIRNIHISISVVSINYMVHVV